MAYARTVQYGKTFVAFGGRDEQVLNTVYAYDPEADAWNLQEKRLSRPVQQATTIRVKRSSFPDCD